MNCYYHPERPAVASCSECGKGLCQACASKWDPILCDHCAGENLAAHHSKLMRSVIGGVVLLIAGTIFGYYAEDNFFLALVAGYVLAGIPSGWVALNKIRPNIFLFLPIIGWVIYFIVKFVLSYFVGLVAFPINIYKTIKELKENKELSTRVK